MSRTKVHEKTPVDDNNMVTDSNLNYINERNTKDECIDKDFERLSGSDISDGSDFVLIDVVSITTDILSVANIFSNTK